jgi:predicted DNA-binding WGR domain protein
MNTLADWKSLCNPQLKWKELSRNLRVKSSAVLLFRGIIQGMFTYLKKVDPEEHMDRWYMVFVQASLFDPDAVICAWGNRRNSYQQLRVLPAASREEALQTAQGIVKQKLGRGYEIVSEGSGDDYIKHSSRRISRSVSITSASCSAVMAGRGMVNASPVLVSK